MEASGCVVVECRIWNREVAGSNLGLGYFAPSSTQPSIPPGSVNEYQLRLGWQSMAHFDCGWTCGCAGKTVRSLENTCHTWALLRWWFTKKRYIECMDLYLYLYFPRSPEGGLDLGSVRERREAAVPLLVKFNSLLLTRGSFWRVLLLLNLNFAVPIYAHLCEVLPLVVWHCWLGDRKDIRPVKRTFRFFAFVDLVSKGRSDHLQLIKFWPSRDPVKGVCGGRNFLPPPYYSQRTVFASLSGCFFSKHVFPLGEYATETAVIPPSQWRTKAADLLDYCGALWRINIIIIFVIIYQIFINVLDKLSISNYMNLETKLRVI